MPRILGSASRKGHISPFPLCGLSFNLQVGAGIKAALTISPRSVRSAPLLSRQSRLPLRALLWAWALGMMGMPAPAAPSTQLEGSERPRPSPASTPSALPFGCLSAWWAAAWQLVLSRPGTAGRGNSGQLLLQSKWSLELDQAWLPRAILLTAGALVEGAFLQPSVSGPLGCFSRISLHSTLFTCSCVSLCCSLGPALSSLLEIVVFSVIQSFLAAGRAVLVPC